jgi:hypothetical protein
MTTGGHVSTVSRRAIARVFDHLDYAALGQVYCYEGGREFWKARREPCRRLGSRIGTALLARLKPGGRSLYVGAGVAELPAMLIELLDLQRSVSAYNLRRREVALLNRACRALPLRFYAADAARATGSFDHLWMVSVLNDPERFPQLAALSYGRAVAVTFDPRVFQQERNIVRLIVNRCLSKLAVPGLVTTSTEEVAWIADWCHRQRIPYLVERKYYPTALVGDPVCFMRIGRTGRRHQHRTQV